MGLSAARLSRRGVLGAALVAATSASAFPDRVVRLIVPTPAGGGTDVAARLIARELAGELGQSVIVENRVGGNGVIGSSQVAQSPPDGHTLLMAAASVMALNPHLIRNLTYDPLSSFSPIAFVGETTVMMAVAPRTPFRSLADVIEAARKDPAGLSYATPGFASMPHLMGEIISGAAGVNLVPVPFRGGSEATTAVMGGQVDVMIDSLTTVLPLAAEGRVRVIVSGAPARMTQMPDTPVLSETFPGTEAAGWFAVFGPAGMPAPVQGELNRRLDLIVRRPAVQERLAGLGLYPVADNTPAALAQRVAHDLHRYGEVIRSRNIKSN